MNGRVKKAFRIPEVLDTVEQKRLLQQPNQGCPTGLRNYCILRLMLNAGLRVAELLNLETGDIDFNSGKTHIRQGKGKKDRILWVNEKDLKIIQEWQSIRPTSQYLFSTLKGKKISDRYLREMVKRYATKAGIVKDIHPHSLRHSFGTDLYRDSHNIRLVQKALGHADISTTMIYTHIIDTELEDAMKRFRTDND